MTEPEKLVGRQEINFYGEFFKEMIEDGTKTLTLRLPKEGRHYERGESVVGKTDKGEIELVIILDEKMQLEQIPELMTLADGFLEPDDAIDALKKYYPNSEITIETDIEVVVFLPKVRFDELDDETRLLLTTLRPEELYRNPKTRAPFLISSAFWAGEYNFTIEEWMLLLRKSGVTKKEYVYEVVRKLREEYSNSEVEHLLTSRDGLYELLGLGEGQEYEMIVLGKMPQKTPLKGS